MRGARRGGTVAALAAAWLAAATDAAAEAPRIDYMLHCQGCHLADGSGSPGAVPDLRDDVGRYLRAPGGRAYLVRVPGSAQSPLGDAALAEVLNWMVRRFGPSEVAADFAPFTAAEVAGYRSTRLSDVPAARSALRRALERIEAAGVRRRP